ncbi:hypothetical protein COS59_01765 [Candidatus Wolfebacteria bacterium CG03_land_8_20_14_0_80_36_15]|uniref:DOD-type homing endonuclease domain-containing protein n=1 Tax=Candidatus Wolfebacteria bacterium CG03_land_8_20_14_0_80_36_15 TaxID=1975067 RepID=A0A2M7B7J9_9BACT|nr:MAG: hypothetical protein COS59_01765 [Candidatus Wolfebacteria bacterium CG03_land_8_20_14_0_80_36_15]
MYKYWSPKEISLLKKFYPKTRVKDLTEIFPNRTKTTIVAKALNLDLPSAKLWQPEENNILRKHFTEASMEELTKLLPKRSKLAIWAQGERLALKRKTDKPRLKVNEDYFKKWSPNMAYILGFILADGCIIRGTYKGYSDALKFGVQKRDIDVLEKIKKELSAEHKISLMKNAAHLCITSQKIVNDLKILKISYQKSLREIIPNVPKKYIRDFIRGIVDGDGGVSIDKTGYPNLSICGGKNTITFIRDYFLKKFNIYSTITKSTSKDKKCYLCRIAYRCNSAKTILDYLYNNANLYLERKFQIAKQCLAIEMKYRKNYSQKEKQLIKQFYPVLFKNKILSMLPNRNWLNIQQQASKLNIHKYNISK